MVTVAKLLLQRLILEGVLRFLGLVVCQLLVFLLQTLVLVMQLVQFRNVRLLCHATLGFNHLVLLEVTKILKRLCDLLVGELIFELICVQVELSNHFIDLFDMCL